MPEGRQVRLTAIVVIVTVVLVVYVVTSSDKNPCEADDTADDHL